MAFDLSAASNILKVRYLPPIREQLNNSTILMSRIAREDNITAVSGKTFTVPLHTGRNVYAGSGRSDGAALPQVGSQAYEVAVIPNAYLYAQIEVTGPVVRAARDSAGAFVTAIESEIRGATRDFKRAFNRQLHGNGTGALAYWTGADDTSGTNVDDSQGNAFVHLPKGQAVTVDVIDASDNATKLGDSIVMTRGADGATSVAVTWTGTVSGSADADYAVLEDTLGNEMMGIRGIISASDPPLASLQGLAVASKVFWKATERTASGVKRALSLPLMQDTIDAIVIDSDFDEKDINLMLGNLPIRSRYYDLLIQEKRFVNTMELDGGFTGLEFNGRPFVVDNQCDRSKIWFITTESLRIYRTSDFDWMEKDGAVLHRLEGYDKYRATMFHYGNLGVTARNANGVLGDLIDTLTGT